MSVGFNYGFLNKPPLVWLPAKDSHLQLGWKHSSVEFNHGFLNKPPLAWLLSKNGHPHLGWKRPAVWV